MTVGIIIKVLERINYKPNKKPFRFNPNANSFTPAPNLSFIIISVELILFTIQQTKVIIIM